MKADDLTPAQAAVIRDKVRPMLVYRKRFTIYTVSTRAASSRF
jgi:hypothetical protein